MRVGWRVAFSVVMAGVAVAITAGIGWLGGNQGVDQAFTIERFDRAVIVEADGSTVVQEIIDVSFHTSRRGIFRDLPNERRFAGGGWQILSVDRGVDNQPWNHVVEAGPDGPRVRIGDASVWLNPGAYRYRLRMAAPTWSHVLADDPSIVETRIDVPGYEWPTSVDAGMLAIRLPGDIIDVTCVEGPIRTVNPCANEPMIDGDTAVIVLGPYQHGHSATVAVRTNTANFTTDLPVYDATPLGTGWVAPLLPTDPVIAALVVAALVALPLLLLDVVYGLVVYRDRVTDPAIHDQATPTAVFAPPLGINAIEAAGLLRRTSSNPLFLAKLVDLDQRGLILTTASDNGKTTELTVERNPEAEATDEIDRKFIDALLPANGSIRFSGAYSASVARRVRNASGIVTRRARTAMVRHGLQHDGGKALRNGGTKILLGLAVIGWAALLAWLFALNGALPGGSVIGVAAVITAAWGIAHSSWAPFRLPLNSEGRKAIAEANAFREFVRTVEADQLEWAAGQPGISHLHPALSLLPYAIVFGFADSWYQRFSGVMAQLAVASGTTAAAGGTAWWASQQSFSGVRSSQSATTTAPSSSSGGGGGGGSGGGGGGGGSW